MQDATLPEGELTVEDIIAEANQAEYHTILEVWREVLRPAETQIDKRITPQWASRIVNTYSQLTYADMPAFREAYFGGVLQLAEILEAEISSDDECLNLRTADEDAELNSHHYINVLFDWQKQFLTWEMEWDCSHPQAAVTVAAISEVHKMFFNPEGLTALLDQINFQFTDADRDRLAEELAELMEGGSE